MQVQFKIYESNKADNVIDIIKSFGEKIKKASGNKIDYVLEKISPTTGIDKLINVSAGLVNNMKNSIESDTIEKSKEKVPDYTQSYKFVIFTEKYYYRAFTITFGVFYPIKLISDGGLIYPQTEEKSISDEETLIDYINRIGRSAKFQSIVSQMLESKLVKA